MNNDINHGRWSEISGRIRAKWGKFSNSEIQSLEGNLDELAGKIQKVYGYAKGQAEREYHEFRLSIRSILHPVTKTNRPESF